MSNSTTNAQAPLPGARSTTGSAWTAERVQKEMRSLCDQLDTGREIGAPPNGSDIVLFERAHAILAEALDAVEDD